MLSSITLAVDVSLTQVRVAASCDVTQHSNISQSVSRLLQITEQMLQERSTHESNAAVQTNRQLASASAP